MPEIRPHGHPADQPINIPVTLATVQSGEVSVAFQPLSDAWSHGSKGPMRDRGEEACDK